jgi:hypothetical protein
VTKRFFLTSFFALLMVLGIAAGDDFRTDIDVFPYASDTGGVTSEAFNFLRNRINHMTDRLYSSNNQLIALRDVQVNPMTELYPDTMEKREGRWKKQKKELIFCGGEVHHPSSSRMIIISNVYLGEDKGLLVGPMIAIRVDDDDYRMWKELHGAVALYALASDAARIGADPQIRRGYLSEANSYLAELKNLQLPQPFDEQRDELFKAVQNDLNNVKSMSQSTQAP